MAESVQVLLTLPVTSNAFTSLRPSVIENPDATGSPPRKSLRLDADGDSTARHHKRDSSITRDGPVRIQVVGLPASTQPARSLQQLLTSLKRCIQTVLTKDAPSLPLTREGVYTACRSVVCVARSGGELYAILKLEVEKCVTTLTRGLSRDTEERKAMLGYVADFVDACRWFETQVALLQSLLSYLDQMYALKYPGTLPIRALCFAQFANIFLDPQIMSRLVSSIKDWITAERDTRRDTPKRDLIPLLIKHLITHGWYQHAFEEPFLAETRAYYTAESARLATLHAADGLGFLHKVTTRIKEEVQRSKELLPVPSWSEVRKTAQGALLAGHLVWLAQSAVPTLMDNKDIKGMATIYDVYAQVDGLKVLCTAFKVHVEASIRKIVTEPMLDDDMVQRLLEFKSFIDAVMSGAFVESHSTPDGEDGAPAPSTSTAPASKPKQDFIYARQDAFTAGFAARPNKPAELLAKHLDQAMRKGQRDLSDAQFARSLDDVLGLYRFTKDKDVFRVFYLRALAKRLLLDRSASDDFEKAILKKLKDEFDPEFGSCNQMFTDLALSKDLMSEYHAKMGPSSQKLTVRVLQRSVWPFAARRKDLDLPIFMQDELKRFTDFYATKHKNHRLYWHHLIGTAILKARFDAGSKDLTVGLYQAVVLLLFNDTDELSYRDIKAQTNMVCGGDTHSGEFVADEPELKRTLQSLACGKKKVLRKSPPGRDVDETDVFRFNADYTDPHARVHINSVQVKETPEESKQTQDSIEGDRKHFLDAAIVRVMKARKEITNEELKAATIEAVQNHFVPDVKTIKQRIEWLCEAEYLRRDEDDPNLYIYVA